MLQIKRCRCLLRFGWTSVTSRHTTTFIVPSCRTLNRRHHPRITDPDHGCQWHRAGITITFRHTSLLPFFPLQQQPHSFCSARIWEAQQLLLWSMSSSLLVWGYVREETAERDLLYLLYKMYFVVQEDVSWTWGLERVMNQMATDRRIRHFSLWIFVTIAR